MDTSATDRALGAIGTTFRLTRLYPATHPAVLEAMRQIAATLPALAALGTVEWTVGATGLHWHGQHLLPRNTQVAELAGLLYARGVRAMTLHPGFTPEHMLSLFGVATGAVPPDDATLGRISLILSRRSSQRLSAARTVSPAKPQDASAVPGVPVVPGAPSAAGQTLQELETPIVGPSPGELTGPRRTSGNVFRPDVLPADVEVRRAIAALRQTDTPELQRAALDRVTALAPDLLAMKDVAVVAEMIAALDALLGKAEDPAVIEAVGAAAGALSDRAMVERMVARLGEPRVPPAERAVLVEAVGALASLSVGLVLDTFLVSPPDLREPYRAAIRKAADRAIEPLLGRLEDQRQEVVAAAAQFLGHTGNPSAIPLLTPLVRHRAEVVREAALLALAEIGGREIARPAIPPLKDESVLVRTAAAKAIGVAGDASATTVLIRRLDQEHDEGVLAEILGAIGRLGATEALEVLATYAEPGGMLKRRTPFVRSAAIAGLAQLLRPEARALIELYSHDKEPTVRRAAEAMLK